MGDKVWFHISKDKIKGEGKKLRSIWYGPFTILENIGNNAFHLDLLVYMKMYSVVNVENLKLYEPHLIMNIDEVGTVPTVDDFAPKYLDEFPEDIILDRRTRTSRQGNVEYLRVVFKGMHPNKAKWLEKEKVRKLPE